MSGLVRTTALPWAELARFPLAAGPTPLVRAHRLEAALGIGPLLVKRDDLIGFGVAGNKTRPLEFLVGAAVQQGARVFVTGGGPGSNFCAAAAMAARAAGLACELHVWGDPRSANLALATAAGATLVPTGGSVREEVDEQVMARVAQLGASAYGVPRGAPRRWAPSGSPRARPRSPPSSPPRTSGPG
ncbi:pyridoxal-phosphate dependent enzyme [Pseudonocardia benzenivorans]